MDAAQGHPVAQLTQSWIPILGRIFQNLDVLSSPTPATHNQAACQSLPHSPSQLGRSLVQGANGHTGPGGKRGQFAEVDRTQVHALTARLEIPRHEPLTLFRPPTAPGPLHMLCPLPAGGAVPWGLHLADVVPGTSSVSPRRCMSTRQAAKLIPWLLLPAWRGCPWRAGGPPTRRTPRGCVHWSPWPSVQTVLSCPWPRAQTGSCQPTTKALLPPPVPPFPPSQMCGPVPQQPPQPALGRAGNTARRGAGRGAGSWTS